MAENIVHKIRPAGRHILTIGRDLIQDQYAAVVELVKNAYDADSPDVVITFKVMPDRHTMFITIQDHGHGMDKDTVINKWLVPSTDDKLKRKVSPNGRTMQGRKGVGRYAASILGNDLLLDTVTDKGEKTTVFVEWDSFENATYLDDVVILVETTQTQQSRGTCLTIKGDERHLAEWTKKQIDKLDFELKKLISPVSEEFSKGTDIFKITIKFDNFWEDPDQNISRDIISYPIFELYNYKISGLVHADGTGQLTFHNNSVNDIPKEVISFCLHQPTNCGDVQYDIRAYDRDKDSIDELIQRGLKDENGNYLGKLQAKQLLDLYNGIGVYRNGFRIRPLGDPDYDWLKLAEKRVQNPGLRISSNQVIGYVLIQPEEFSGLEEKSARDGLRDNIAYRNLVAITLRVINLLEERRFVFRRKTGVGKSLLKVESELNRLSNLDDLKQTVMSDLANRGIDKNTTDGLISHFEEHQKKTKIIADELKQTVAVYQGQATLGKIINVILHEGRRPLNYFKNQIPNLKIFVEQFVNYKDPDTLKEVMLIAQGLGDNAEAFVTLFSRLDPLAAGKRGEKIYFKIKNAIEGAFKVFEGELKQNRINYTISCSSDLKLIGWAQDINVIMTNLIDNSIYWIDDNKSSSRNIDVIVQEENKVLQFIDYRDTGPGIEQSLIESGIIFEPEFTRKPHGQGLGLPIAGEAATRNNLELKAMVSDSGAYFRIQPVVLEET